jgi:hypothetical protein
LFMKQRRLKQMGKSGREETEVRRELRNSNFRVSESWVTWHINGNVWTSVCLFVTLCRDISIRYKSYERKPSRKETEIKCDMPVLGSHFRLPRTTVVNIVVELHEVLVSNSMALFHAFFNFLSKQRCTHRNIGRRILVYWPVFGSRQGHRILSHYVHTGSGAQHILLISWYMQALQTC